MNIIEKFYDDNVEREWLRLERHRTEFAVTLHALAEFLPQRPSTILDIGGGPGRYAIALAQQGHAVTLVDLSQNNLRLAQQKAQEAGITLTGFVQANALDLADLPRSSYDAVLLLGPLYHLLTYEEQVRALQEAKQTLKPTGYIFAAFITRFAPIRAAAKYDPEWVINHPESLEQILQTGVYQVNRDVVDTFTQAHFAHPAEIEPLMESLGFSTLRLMGCEGIVAGNEEKINELSGQAWGQWVALNYRLGQEATLLGAADHILYVGQVKA